jgi:hypothetical protein
MAISTGAAAMLTWRTLLHTWRLSWTRGALTVLTWRSTALTCCSKEYVAPCWRTSTPTLTWRRDLDPDAADVSLDPGAIVGAADVADADVAIADRCSDTTDTT